MASDPSTRTGAKQVVLLDSNVIISYLRGKPKLAKLFASEVLQSVQYATNPIILQELRTSGPPFPEGFDLEEFSRSLIQLPINPLDSEEFLDALKTSRNKSAHANSFLVLGSGKSCDFVLSYDVNLLDLAPAAGVTVLNPDAFLARWEPGA
ncbi:MAG: hypothetical protein ABI353_15795 [Isosphaeraceae bacterium]